MAIDNTVTISGNITQDPQLAHSASGVAYLRFGIAWNQLRGDEQIPNYFDVTVFNQMAVNASRSLSKGQRVTVNGRLEQSSWIGEDGTKRSSVKILADDIAPSLKWATAAVTKSVKQSTTNEPMPVPDPDEHKEAETDF
jgi:single-strand DNA-binding protein